MVKSEIHFYFSIQDLRHQYHNLEINIRFAPSFKAGRGLKGGRVRLGAVRPGLLRLPCPVTCGEMPNRMIHLSGMARVCLCASVVKTLLDAADVSFCCALLMSPASELWKTRLVVRESAGYWQNSRLDTTGRKFRHCGAAVPHGTDGSGGGVEARGQEFQDGAGESRAGRGRVHFHA